MVTLDEMYAYYPGGAARGSDTPAGTGEDDGVGDPGVEGGSGRSAEASGGDGRLGGIGALPKPLELSASFFDGNDVYVLGGSSGLEGSASIYRIYRSEGTGEDGDGDDDGDGQVPFAGAAALIMVLLATTACLAITGGRRR